MFKDEYVRKYDEIRPDPAFRARLEKRMRRELARKQAGKAHLSRRGMIVLAAVLALALSATAIAVYDGLLRRRTENVPEVAAGIADVNAKIEQDGGFSFSVDEVLWQDTMLELSYSLSVPDDGKTYLVGFYAPELNGEKIYINDATHVGISEASLLAVGNGFPTTTAGVMRLHVEPRMQKPDNRELIVPVVFFTTDRPIVQLESQEAYVAMINEGKAKEKSEGKSLFGRQQFQSSDTFYYVYNTDQGTPWIDMLDYGEMLDARDAHYNRYLEESGMDSDQLHMNDALLYDAYTLDPASIAATGLVQLESEASVSMQLTDSMLDTKQFNALAETTIDNGEYTIEITEFKLSRLRGNYCGRVRRNDGAVVEEDMSMMLILYKDGTKLTNGCWLMGDDKPLEDGSRIFTGMLYGYIQLDDVQNLLLAPCIYDENNEVHYDLTRSFKLTPIYDEAAAIAEVNTIPEPPRDPSKWDGISS